MSLKNTLVMVLCSLLMATSCKKANDAIQQPPVVVIQPLTITGRVTDCTAANVIEGRVAIILSDGEFFYTPVTNGSFSLTVTPQQKIDSLKACATDYNTLKYSDTTRKLVTGNNIDLGIINSCVTNVPEYFRYKIDATDYTYVPKIWDSIPVISWNYTGGEPMTSFYRECQNANCEYPFQIQFDGHSVGTFAVTGRAHLFVKKYYSFNMPGTGSITYTAYGNVGGYVTGSLYVPFKDNTDSLNHLMTGTFKLRRKT